MKGIVVGDMGKIEYLERLLEIDLEKYDFFLFTGDMSGTPSLTKLGKARGMEDEDYIPEDRDPKEFYKEQIQPSIRKLRKVDKIAGKIRESTEVFGVWGNADFKRVVEKVDPGNIKILHKKMAEVNGVYLTGYNGHPTYPWEIKHPQKKDIFGYTYKEIAEDVNSFRESEIYNDLKKTTSDLPNAKTIIVTHTPPYKILDRVKPEMREWAEESYGERAKEGNVGSTGLKDFLLEFEPSLSIFGHIHEGRGVKKEEGTTFVNAGSFGEDGEAIRVKISQGEVEVSNIKV